MYFTVSMNSGAYANFIYNMQHSAHIKNNTIINANNGYFNTPAAEFKFTYIPGTSLLYVTPRTTNGPAVMQTNAAALAYFNAALVVGN